MASNNTTPTAKPLEHTTPTVTPTVTPTITPITTTATPSVLNTTTKKPIYISIDVNYSGFIKYANNTDIIVPSLTTTKISKYVINIGKLVSTSTSSTPEPITPNVTPSATTTKSDVVIPTSIPPIKVYAANGEYYSDDVYLTYKATGTVYESGNAVSLPTILTPAYDNSNFIFSSKYNWYYIKNGETIEVNADVDHEISLSVLASTSIYIKISSSTTPISTLTEHQKTTQTPSSTSTVLTNSTTNRIPA